MLGGTSGVIKSTNGGGVTGDDKRVTGGKRVTGSSGGTTTGVSAAAVAGGGGGYLRGWVGVSGVKGSGKTTALLQACHILAAQAQGLEPGLGLARGQGLGPGQGSGLGQGREGSAPPSSSSSSSRDFVWVDLAGVSSDMEVISRIAQQLGLAQQVDNNIDNNTHPSLLLP